jgi:hypothetical protein
MRAESVKKKYNSECYNEMRMRLPSLSVNEGMARAAVAAMLQRLRDPSLPPRQIQLDAELIVRASTERMVNS